MSEFYGRRYSLDVDGKTFISETGDKQFKITFNVLLEFGAAVAYADIAIYNLAQDTSQNIIKKNMSLVLRAGYENKIDNIFTGRIINVLRRRDGPHTIIRLICRGGTQTDTNTISESLGKNVTIVSLIKSCVKAMGYPIIINEDDFKGPSPYTRGFTLNGDPKTNLDQLAASHGFDYMIENDAVLIVSKKSFRKGEPLKISQFKGLVGIPEITVEGANVKIKLNPGVKIGGRIDVQSVLATFNFSNIYYLDIPASAGKGIYKIYRVVHSGDSHGDNWDTDITAYRPEVAS